MSEILLEDTESLQYVDFDPFNKEHRIAYVMLAYELRQHPTLRFTKCASNRTTIEMMQSKMADALALEEIVSRIGTVPKSLSTVYQEKVIDN